MIKFQNTDLAQVLQIYGELVNRTVLRPATLPAPTISLTTQTPLTRKEAMDALKAFGDDCLDAEQLGRRSTQDRCHLARQDALAQPSLDLILVKRAGCEQLMYRL